MGGRSFDQRNVSLPAAVEALADKTPPCFEKKIWRLYLIDCYRGALNDPASRARINRGEMPDFCSECQVGYSNRMKAAGKCQPPAPADTNKQKQAEACA